VKEAPPPRHRNQVITSDRTNSPSAHLIHTWAVPIDDRADLPRLGAVVRGPARSLPYVVVDAAGREVEPVSVFLWDLQLSDVSPLTCRSYGHDLLRWFRLLWAVDVGWEQATEVEAATLVGWPRLARNPQRHRRQPGGYPPGSVNPKTGKPVPAAGYAAATIAHNLAVVHGFYAFHRHFGLGLVLNPVPESKSRRAALAHASPIETPARYRRGTAAAQGRGAAAPRDP